jgi:hypothetical protein
MKYTTSRAFKVQINENSLISHNPTLSICEEIASQFISPAR